MISRKCFVIMLTPYIDQSNKTCVHCKRFKVSVTVQGGGGRHVYALI